MRNNKILQYGLILSMVMLIFVISAHYGFAADITEHTPTTAAPVSFHNAVIKFLKAMGGVALSSFIIFAGLAIYNRFFVKQRLDGNREDDVLKNSHSVDEALIFFIKQNKLK